MIMSKSKVILSDRNYHARMWSEKLAIIEKGGDVLIKNEDNGAYFQENVYGGVVHMNF